MKTLMQLVMFILLSCMSAGACSYPLCLKEELLVSARFEELFLHQSMDNYEVCPWYLKEVQLLIAKIRSAKDAKKDRFVSVLSFLIGESLMKNRSFEDKDRGREYIQYSFDLACKHGISPEEHLETFTKAK